MTGTRASIPRIAIDAQKLSTGQSYHAAGLSRYVFSLLRELRSINPPEQIVAYLQDARAPPELTATGGFAVRCTTWPTHRPLVRIAWEQAVFPRLLRHEGITLLHGAVNALPLAWRGRTVATIHDLAFLRMPETFRRGSRTYLAWMVRFVARRADCIIAVSEATRNDVIRLLGADPARVVRIYCGVDDRFRRIEDGRVLAEFRAHRRLPERFILYLGTIEPRKNLVRLIDAYTALRRGGVTRWPLVLAGGVGWGYEDVFRRVSELRLEEDVRFVGYVPEHEMALWYNAASLFVYPSQHEGFGLPVLEALACGTPVVTSNRSSLPEVVGATGILVDPTDAGSMAEGIQRGIEDERFRALLASQGPQRAASFSWRRTAEETLSVYRTVTRSS
ncbi:MAG: glycosyltransferase [Chloroflexi bacterium]|nr:glycosyltransferase [Chloroflexota bacterium]